MNDQNDKSESGLVMPPDDQTAESQPAPAPSFGRQMAQLVVIPAAIVLVAIAVIYPIAKMASSEQSIENLLVTLQRSQGMKNDRWLAAYSLAKQVPSITDAHERAMLSGELIDILEQASANDAMLQRFLIIAIAKLEQEGSIEVILRFADSADDEVRYAVVESLRYWHDHREGKVALGALVRLLEDPNPQVKGFAASALGRFADPTDQTVMVALRRAMRRGDLAHREARWDAAVALARLGDSEASQLVANLLLDRRELASMQLAEGDQDQVILSALSAADRMTDTAIWAKIEKLAAMDPNRRVKAEARELVLVRKRDTLGGPDERK